VGGYAVGNPTLNRFYSLHYLAVRDRRRGGLHIWALHMVGQNNPTGIEPQSEKDTVAFTPYATIKDAFLLAVILILLAWFVFYIPNYLGHSDNYIPANPAVTPMHIVPEWYLPAVLRHSARDPSKLGGVIALVASIWCSPSCHGSTHRRCARRAIARSSGSSFGYSGGLRAARLSGLKAAGRRLRHRRANLYRLLLHLLPDHSSHPRLCGNDQAASSSISEDVLSARA